MPQLNRYARQMQLADIGEAGQEVLGNAHVAVIGAGGLGCPILQYLAGAGVGRISIYDPDIIEESNLHRQPLYRMADLGRAKAQVARETLSALNPHIRIDAHTHPIGPSTAPALAVAADVVIDAADSFAVSYILSDACMIADTPLISASALGQTGYVGAFCGGAPSLRAVFPELPQTGATCATAGVLGPVVGTIGALQAQITLRVLLNTSPPALGHMITADLAALTFGGFSFVGSPEPTEFFTFISKAMCGDDDFVIDLRNETPEIITPQARRIHEAELPTLHYNPDQRVVLCCTSGLRAWRGAQALKSRGATKVALIATRACT